MSPARRRILLITAGAALGLSFAPFYQWWLALPIMALLWHLRPRGKTLRQDLLEGWLVGFGLFGANVSWVWISIHDFGYAPGWLATLLTALFAAGLALFTLGHWWTLSLLTRYRALTPLSFAATWVVWEWIRSGLLTGFPWLYVGTGWVDSPAAPAARWIGAYGIGFLVILIATSAASALAQPNRRAITTGTLALFALITTAIGGHYVGRTQPAGRWNVALVQGAIAQDIKWQPAYQSAIIRRYMDLTAPWWSRADLVLWPETALPVFYKPDAGFFEQLDLKARQTSTALGYGVLLPDQDGHYANGLVWQGLGEGLYRKQKLVPFGEYVPLESLLRGIIAFFDLPMSDMRPGPPDQPLQYVRGVPVAAFICYEIVYPDFVAHRARDAQLLVTVSNDAWFGLFAGPAQHMQIARMRAVEQDKTLLRAANRGHTGIITPDGEVLQPVDPARGGVSFGQAELRQGHSFYSATGSLPLMLTLALLVIFELRRGQLVAGPSKAAH